MILNFYVKLLENGFELVFYDINCVFMWLFVFKSDSVSFIDLIVVDLDWIYGMKLIINVLWIDKVIV